MATIFSTPLTIWPPEIRNQIYETLFELDSPITLAWTGDDYGRRYVITASGHRGRISKANLLATCRQVNREASGVLYSRNVFHFRHDNMTPNIWLTEGEHAGEVNIYRFLLRKIVVDFPRYYSPNLHVWPFLNQIWLCPETATEAVLSQGHIRRRSTYQI